ncbi:DICT sensory domain-containing protein [Segeticoccus rhizosphaerae]|jgi:DICT domain-containing protein|uniref:DICT sensory domain-containing protein n=1 Tax=Segeticoccus rhizosphaerae TaxID=1104777 RepID=UPI0013900738|nr:MULTISPECIES: DICT sensory domain-containing protein [Intrasporangiaceae]
MSASHNEEQIIDEQGQDAELTIGDLSVRTGVPQATLRTWETRHGVPVPRRLRGGHRRYTDRDVELVQEILRRRAAGLNMEAAVQSARSTDEHVESSVFSALRHRHPELRAHVLRKSTLLALTRAVEDECCARAEQPALFVSFQQRRFYRQSQARWLELARTASAVVVFADFPRRPAGSRWPLQVPVPTTEPMRREWALVCDCPDYPAAIAGWEQLGPEPAADSDRRFETVWTVDPAAVRDAARACVEMATRFAPQSAGRLGALLADTPAPASADLARAAGLLDRMVSYLERST